MTPTRRIPRYILKYLSPAHAVSAPGAAVNRHVTTTSPTAVARATTRYASPKAGGRANPTATAATRREENAIARTAVAGGVADRKSTRLNSRHDQNSDADFCLKKHKT